MHGTTLLRSLRNTPANTPLRRLAEEGETDEPHEAAAMLANLLRHHRPGPDVLHTLRRLHSLLKRGNHLLISDGVIYEPFKEVQKWIREGWKPQGGIASTDTGLYQAMVRFQNESPPSS